MKCFLDITRLAACFWLSFGLMQLIAGAAATAIASPEERDILPICSGFDPSHGVWGLSVDVRGEGSDNCPSGSALMAIEAKAKPFFVAPSSMPIAGTCCPLPPDALTPDEQFVTENCPDGWVATGALGRREADASRITFFFRCQRINSDKFALGTPTNAWIFGPNVDVFRDLISKPWQVEAKRTVRSRIPLAFRYGFMRAAPHEWQDSGCIGMPWGSLLTARTYAHCSGVQFRQLQRRFRHHTGTEETLPVPVEECQRLDNIFSPFPRCLSRDGS